MLDAVRAALAGLPDGNPQSPHAEGRAARAALDAARDRAAAALEVDAGDLVWCSGGTEAVNLALLGAGRRLPPSRRVVTWEAEHQAVLGAVRQLQAEGRPVTVLPVDGAARAGAEGIPADTGLVSIGLANNEVGTLQPVAEVAARARALGALLHLDACQGPTWVRPPVELADLASFSGHKLGAGRGGLLFARRTAPLLPLQFGGPQEWGRRAGREDLAAAVAVAVALAECAARRAEWSAAAAAPAARLRGALEALGGRLTGPPPGLPRCLPNFASAAFARVRGEDLVLSLDLAGVAVSSGSACASGSLDPSHVLLAMGLSMAEALGSLRLTTGPQTTAAEVELGCRALATVVRTDGRPPSHLGAKALLARGRALAGTLGCSEFDAAALADTPGLLDTGGPALRTYRHDLGSIEVYLEPHLAQPALLVVADTPVGRALARWAPDVGFRTATAEGLADLPAELGAELYVVHTNHDAPDLPDLLARLLERDPPPRYLGLMGSRRHTGHHLDALAARGFDQAALARIQSPVGIDLGARTPEEIALSMLAGLVAVRRGARVGWLDPPRTP